MGEQVLKLDRVPRKPPILSSARRLRRRADERIGSKAKLRRSLISKLGIMPDKLAWGQSD